MGRTPNHIHNLTDPSDIKIQFNLMYKKNLLQSNPRTFPLTIGQAVRIADERRNWVFRRGYTVQNTLEIFKVKQIDTSQSPTVYYLEDLQGESIKGIFYQEELVPCILPEFYHIDMIRSIVVSGRKKYLVRWRGYPDTFNSWIDQSQLAPA